MVGLADMEDREFNSKVPGWNQTLLHLEGLIRDNRPANPKRIMRDMARGKIPF
jgi:hypothetical protein